MYTVRVGDNRQTQTNEWIDRRTERQIAGQKERHGDRQTDIDIHVDRFIV